MLFRSYESSSNDPNADVVEFSDLSSVEVCGVDRLANDLILRFGPSGDQLRVAGYFWYPSLRIEAFRFADGVLWGDAELRDRAVVMGATAGADRLGGYEDMVNRIDGLAGDDTLLGALLADRLIGGSGNDRLSGYGGQDWLDEIGRAHV